MKQSVYGLLLYLFLILPPVAHLMESIMIVHMHMQMPLLAVAGFVMARFFQIRFPGFFEKWNRGGIPGILLFAIVASYWMIPRTMDEAITMPGVEIFKFASLPFLAGLPLRDSWKKLGETGKNAVFTGFTALFLAMGWLYIQSSEQLCNNYLLIDQITLGWGFLTMAACMGAYGIYRVIVEKTM